MHKSLRGSLMLLLAAMVWGFAFVAQRVGMNSMQPLSFNGIRTLLSGVCLLPVLAVTGRRNASPPPAVPSGKSVLLLAGLLCGFFLFLATNLQQAGLVYTDAGKSGFITALYVVLVPVFNYILFRKNPGMWVWMGVAMAVAALFLLCVPTGQHLTLNRGDLLTLGCALCFTGHILTVDYFSPKVDPIRLPVISFCSADPWPSSFLFLPKPSPGRGSARRFPPCSMRELSPARWATRCRSWDRSPHRLPWLPCSCAWNPSSRFCPAR